MSEFKLRTESIKDADIISLAVKNENDKKIIKSLISSEPCLLEGSRGTGKSFLMKISQIELEKKTSTLSIFISFNISSLINTSDHLQFYHWMLAKTLRALLNKLRKKGLSISNYSKVLLSNDTSEDEETIENNLKAIVKLFENSYNKKTIDIDIETLPDIEDVKEAIKEICKENDLERIYFFFDEAAHVFRPEQQRQFFNLFKDLRSPYITCNAAIYPGVTHFGDSFEPIHDCVYEVLDRNIADNDYLEYFKKMVLKQADASLRKSIKDQGQLFNTLALSCGGNPRILLKTLQEMEKFNTNEVNRVIKDFYRIKIWAEHTELGEKYKGHQFLIDWGRDFLEKTVIPTVIENEKSSIYFWVHKDIPETIKESLRLLTYTGIIKKIDAGIRSHGDLGTRFEIKYGCIIALNPNPNQYSTELFKIRDIRRFNEFGNNHKEYEKIKNLSASILEDEQYRESLESMLNKPINVLSLTKWQKERLIASGFITIRDLYGLKENDLIEKIYNVGPIRARIMMNAANSELLEYISG
ncbi:hypothetical protein [Flavobacterium sp. SM2513]|uniref:hypothetical protein n=1 Tax=Flavobacterium sp. SM2513 TaxID=3424766 RepID=UPI003D7F576E